MFQDSRGSAADACEILGPWSQGPTSKSKCHLSSFQCHVKTESLADNKTLTTIIVTKEVTIVPGAKRPRTAQVLRTPERYPEFLEPIGRALAELKPAEPTTEFKPAEPTAEFKPASELGTDF